MSSDRTNPPYSPIWQTQTEIGKLFGLSAIAVGKKLTELGLKDKSGPTKQALEENLCFVQKSKRYAQVFLWDCTRIQRMFQATGLKLISDETREKLEQKRTEKSNEEREKRRKSRKRRQKPTDRQLAYLESLLPKAHAELYLPTDELNALDVGVLIDDLRRNIPCSSNQLVYIEMLRWDVCDFYPKRRELDRDWFEYKDPESWLNIAEAGAIIDALNEVIEWANSGFADFLAARTQQSILVLQKFFEFPEMMRWYRLKDLQTISTSKGRRKVQ